VRAFRGETWLVTGKPDGPIAQSCDEVVVCTPAIEESWCHTASYTCAVAAIAAMRGEDVAWLPGAVADALESQLPAVGAQDRFLVAGAGRDLATAHEATLKLREGAWVACEAYETEQLLHGYFAAVDESVRAFVLEGEGRAAERAAGAVAGLEALGCEATLVPTRHPVVDVVMFQRLAVAIADARGRNPDRIHRDDPRWADAAQRSRVR
jgi:glutamine---fructose-6-phosphate transaminase (isomerizing)